MPQTGESKQPGRSVRPLMGCPRLVAVHNPRHTPVMLRQVVELLAPKPGEVYVDGTAGFGGHAAAVGALVGPTGTVILNDMDPGNLAAASRYAEATGARVVSIPGNFASLPAVMSERSMATDMFLADLGFASNHVDDAERGFSFGKDGPLDMRLDPKGAVTAADLVNSLPENELDRLIREYGEDRNARRIARQIVKERQKGPLQTTTQLANAVRAVSSGGGAGIDPATRTFQAIRIAVNDELGSLEAVLESVVEGVLFPEGASWLKAGARVAFISFHSLEDRLVKRAFQRAVANGATDIGSGMVVPADEECDSNPRSRSAKLRAIRLPESSHAELPRH